MRQKRDDFDEIKQIISQRLDWNLQNSEVAAWGVRDGRLQVILIDRGPRNIEDTREYMKIVSSVAGKEKIDLTVFHTQKT